MKYNISEEINKLRYEYLEKYNIMIDFIYLNDVPHYLEGDFNKIKNLFEKVFDYLIKQELEKITVEMYFEDYEGTYLLDISVTSEHFKVDKRPLDTSFVEKELNELDGDIIPNPKKDFGLELLINFPIKEYNENN